MLFRRIGDYELLNGNSSIRKPTMLAPNKKENWYRTKIRSHDYSIEIFI